MAVLDLLQKQRPPREALKIRQQEIERCLVAYGVTRETGRRTYRSSVAGGEHMQPPRLRQALESLGPIFSAFGLYMASRVDLLLVHERLELAAITDWAEPTPSATVRELIARETGRSLARGYRIFEDEPCESRLLFQSHRAWLNDGKAVTVKVVHPELQKYLECDLELLPILQPAFAGTIWHGTAFEDAIADFCRILQWQIDLLYGAKVFEMLTRDAQEFEMLKVPRVDKELCSSQMLTMEQLPGTPLGEMITAYEQTEIGRSPTVFEAMGLDASTFARRLCMVWLRQVLLGKQFPIELCPEDIVILPNNQIAFTGGVFASLPSDAKKNLWHYLMATSTEDPDNACSYLLREIEPKGRSINEDELRYRFREIVPFRDGGWRGSGDSSSLTEHLFVHWKLVSERGLQPQRHLLCFYRGLFQILAMVRRFAPDSDPLLEGLQDVRMIMMFGQFQEMLAWGSLGNNLEKYSTLLMELPQKFDHALTLMAERQARPPLQGTRFAQHQRQRNSSVVVIALCLTLVAVVLLSRHLAISAHAGVWVDRASAIAFVVLGALLLRAASRS